MKEDVEVFLCLAVSVTCSLCQTHMLRETHRVWKHTCVRVHSCLSAAFFPEALLPNYLSHMDLKKCDRSLALMSFLHLLNI